MRQVLIVGAGGHAKVIADAALAAGWGVAGFVDDVVREAPLPGSAVLGTIVDVECLLRGPSGVEVVAAIGDNGVRRSVTGRLAAYGASFATIIHPSAVISPFAEIGPGTVVMAGVAVNPGSRIGEHVVLNTGCSVDHDCVVSAFSHLSPGVRLAGEVRIGEGAHLGIGAVVIQGRRVGEWSVIGAGGVVVDDIPPNVVAYGVPARPRRVLSSAELEVTP